MRAYLNGNEAVAQAVRLARAEVVAAYPITPQSTIVEEIAAQIAAGELDATYICVESEHAALAACYGAAVTGTRVFTATSSQGLAYMFEMLPYVSGNRVPVVMAVVNRGLAAPWTIWADHQDSISCRDAGWIQLYVETVQEALDTCLQAYKIAEDPEVLTPVMLCLDGYVLSHTEEVVELPEQEEVDRFLPPYRPSLFVDPARPLVFGVGAAPEYYGAFKEAQQRAMARAKGVIKRVEAEFAALFGRSYGGLVDPYFTTLSLSVQRMARNKAVVRNLPAVEALGSTTVIYTDKTGTLTKNELVAEEAFAGTKLFKLREGKSRDADLLFLLKAAVLCNNASFREKEEESEVLGNPVEKALLVGALRAGLKVSSLRAQAPRLAEVPFTAEKKYMATLHREGKKEVAYLKGAPEVLLAQAKYFVLRGEVRPLDAPARARFLQAAEEMAQQGLRVMGFAFCENRKIAGEAGNFSPLVELVFIGLVGLRDSLREEAKEAIRRCQRAGIRVVIVTGDHKLTALAVGRELGLEPRAALTGEELEALGEEGLAPRVEEVAVYARVSPAHKLWIVRAWQRRKHVVAMTGDGVNDAPALKSADVGVAMGLSGTEVAKEAADVVLLDDNFRTIVQAVEEGRRIFQNIKKYLFFLLATNTAEVLVCFLAAVLNWALPLLPIHLLWINLVTDGLPALALGVDPPDPDLMKRPPRRPEEGIFTRRLVFLIAAIAAWMTLFLLPVFYWCWQGGGPAVLQVIWGGEGELLPVESRLLKAQTLCLLTFILFKLFGAYNARHETLSLFKLGWHKNWWLNFAVLSSLVATLLVLYHPSLSRAFHMAPLGLGDWLVALAVGSTIILWGEALKLFLKFARRFLVFRVQRLEGGGK